jgi:tRNA modification GTPase
MTATNTIFALSSGAGRSAVAVVRVSGPLSAKIVEGMAGGLPIPRTMALRTIQDPRSGEILDKAIVVWLPAPRSFTGEDCAELHLHGSPAVIVAVLTALACHPSVRPAEPGEFTRRAFVNGKLDLIEVEGLADLLDARTSNQRRQAFRQMSGAASTVFEDWRHQLLMIRADIEAVVDFADEPGVAEEAAPGIDDRIRSLLLEMTRALDGAATAEVIREGVRVVIAGRPNTGKSSLLNALAQRDAAIVSELPGTTRDAIEVSLDIRGVPVILTDTAGLRSNVADVVEEEGVRRSLRHISDADVVVWVWSSDVSSSAESEQFPAAPDIVVQNKCDLDLGRSRNETDIPLRISTRTGLGIPEFIDALAKLMQLRYGDVESSLLVSARQSTAVRNSIRYLNDALRQPAPNLELKAEDVRSASEEIGRLTGRVDVEEWLGAIFSRFCIGK